MARTTVPPPGIPPGRKNLTIHLTPDFRDDLTILMRNGTRASDAIRQAVHHMADAYRRAWDTGDLPPDTDPTIRSCTYSGELRPVQQPTTRAHR